MFSKVATTRRLVICILAVLALPAGGCTGARADSCSDRDSVGHIGDPRSSIARREVRVLVAAVRAGGGNMTEREALADLLWQEAERLRLGLPGGERAEASRREVVRSHLGRIRDGQAMPVRSDRLAHPPGAVLTPCSHALN